MTSETLDSRLRPRREPRQKRSEQTRARILDAAREVFARRGYAGGTTNHIATAAGLSVGSLYQYFPNKDAILVELVNEHVAEGTVAITEALKTIEASDLAEDPGTAIWPVVAVMVEIHDAQRRLHQVLFEESPRPPALLDRLRDLENLAVAALAGLMTRSGVGGPEVEVRARVVVVTIESLVHRLVAGNRTMDPSRVTDEITTMVSRYLET